MKRNHGTARPQRVRLSDRWSTVARGAGAVIALAILVGLAWAPRTSAGAQTTGCKTSGPTSSAYTVTLCFVDPTNGAQLTGAKPVSVSVAVTGANPGIQRILFQLDGQYLLTDYAPPYTFVLPTDRFVDGTRLLAVQALMRDGFTSANAGVSVVFKNGVKKPPSNTGSFTPSTGSTPAPGKPFVLAAAGDGADGNTGAGQVTDLLASWNPNLFLYLGDVYEKGSPTEFYNWYGTASQFYGRLRSITDPTVGNHEYENNQAPGYFDYWNNPPNYYSFDAAGWHFISLNSTNQFAQTAPGSPQYNWLQQDLNAHAGACTVVYFHHPVYTIGPEGDTTRMDDIWSLLAQHKVPLVLTGHDHNYQRWLPLNGAGQLDPSGITEFVVGTGGHGLRPFVRTDERLATGLESFGALRLELNPNGAAYRFIDVEGAALDSGVIPCSGAAPDTAPPSVPTGLTATASSGTHVDLAWSAATDNTGVNGYTIRRNGSVLATVDGATLTYGDDSVAPLTTYTYTVDAFDVAGNHSAQSSAASATTPTVAKTLSFAPVADAYVNESKPTTNYGGATVLRADASPVNRSYLRFNVAGVVGPVTRATLQVYASTSSKIGHDLRGVGDNSWGERTITYANAPSFGSAVGSSGAFGAGTWSSVDVTPLISGNGTYSLALTTNSTAAISYSSRESGANAPRLIVQFNSPPSAGDLSLAVDEDTSAAWTPVVQDVNGDPLTCTIATLPTNGTATVAANCTSGSYTPSANYFGPDSFTYQVSDGSLTDTAAVSVTVGPVNDPPKASDLSLNTQEGLAVGWTPAVADVDVADELSCTVATPPTHGTATVATDCSGGVYTPDANYFGPDSFTYEVSDGSLTATATVQVTVVNPSSVPPTAENKDVTTDEDVAVNITLTASDVDGDCPLAFVVTTAPTHGALGDPANVQCAAGSASAEVSYTPGANFNGSDSFTYQASDGLANSNIATVSITVNAVNDPPTAGNVTLATDEGAAVAWTPVASDPDGDPLTCTIATTPLHGTASVATDCSGGSYTPDANFSGSDSFTYQANDGLANSNIATVSITVAPRTFTFTPVADAYVNESNPTTNYGAATTLRADASPIVRSYLRFSVQGLGGPVKRATLRVYANSSSGTGHDVRLVADNTWGERTITYANAPTVDAIVAGSSGGFSAGSWTTVDVTSLITGNGTFSLAISTPSSTAISYASRESGANSPQLVVETQ